VLQELVRLGEVLAVRALAFVQIGDGVEAHPVDAQVEPEVDDREERFVHGRLSKFRSAGASKSGARNRSRDRIVGPVRGLEVLED